MPDNSTSIPKASPAIPCTSVATTQGIPLLISGKLHVGDRNALKGQAEKQLVAYPRLSSWITAHIGLVLTTGGPRYLPFRPEYL